MKTKLISAVLLAASLMGLGGCATMDNQTVGTIGGAAVGGLVGDAVGGGTGAVLGAARLGPVHAETRVLSTPNR